MTDTPGSPPETGGRRRLTVILAIVSALVLVVAGLVGTRIFGVWGDTDPKAQPTASPTPTGPPSPFAGTPAEDFAEGEAGIELPPAEPVGDFTADQVQDALEQVREALIAARLDESMLVDHDPSAFLSALAPDHRRAQQLMFDSADFATYATQISEDAQLAPVVPRTEGTLAYEAATVEGDLPVIEVTTRFAWVYAFDVEDGRAGGDLIVVRDVLTWVFQEGYPWTEDSQGLWLAEEAARIWGADCAVIDDGRLLPDDEPVATLSAQAEAIFDPQHPLDEAGGC